MCRQLLWDDQWVVRTFDRQRQRREKQDPTKGSGVSGESTRGDREREGGVDSGLSIPVGPHHDRKAQYVTNNANQSNSYIRKRGVIIDDIVHPLDLR